MGENMRKVLSKLLACMFLVAACAGAAACNQSGNETAGIVFGEKYIYYESVNLPESEQRYIIFNRNGKGTYHYYSYYSSEYSGTSINSYTVTFVYTIIEDTALCSFDAVEYDIVDTEKKVRSTWRRTFGVSKDILLDAGITESYHYRESYLKKIPNFGK